MDYKGKHYPGLIELGYDAKATADSYKRFCEDCGYISKFSTFKGKPNY